MCRNISIAEIYRHVCAQVAAHIYMQVQHRDLKSPNILLQKEDGALRAKVHMPIHMPMHMSINMPIHMPIHMPLSHAYTHAAAHMCTQHDLHSVSAHMAAQIQA